MEEIKQTIEKLLEEGLENEYITKDEYNAIDPTEKSAAKFYELFKVHKKHKEGETPPERPIISGNGSVTENLGLFVEYFLKELANKHPTYLQDTPDFLREIASFNEKFTLPDDAVLVTIDVSALYTNIPQEEGLDAAREALAERNDTKGPTDFIIRLL